jgi:hypothetical protein
MTKPVAIDYDARLEIDDALGLSATIGQQAVAEFQNALSELWQLIEANPAIGARVPRTTVRQYPMVKYPYYVIYTEEPNRLRVYAFGHVNRKPNYWKKRLRNP